MGVPAIARVDLVGYVLQALKDNRSTNRHLTEIGMTTKKVWHKPGVDESETGLEVTSYLPADLDHEV